MDGEILLIVIGVILTAMVTLSINLFVLASRLVKLEHKG
mgnify:FL=1